MGGRSRHRHVLDLGAGTGKLTRTLAALGYETIAVEPDSAMRAVISETSPSTRAFTGWAEVIPLLAHSVDAVVVAQAWHWFDHARAGAEVARVVRPGGHVALLYNIRDERVPWVERFARATGERFGAASEPLEFDGVRGRPGFGPVENREFEHAERLSIDDLVALARSFSFVALLPDDERTEVVATVEAIGRGAGGLRRARRAAVPAVRRPGRCGNRVASRARARLVCGGGAALASFIGDVLDTLKDISDSPWFLLGVFASPCSTP